MYHTQGASAIPSPQSELKILKLFRNDVELDVLNTINPWLTRKLIQALEAAECEDAVVRLQKASKSAGSVVAAAKRGLSIYSVYCLFQIASHEDLCQAHLSRGFAKLNVWRPDITHQPVSPILRLERSDTSVVVQSSFSDGVSVSGKKVGNLTCRFESALKDPITIAVCASGGRPFGAKSALAVLREIHEESRNLHDSTAVDARKRDGNELESFVGVALTISSWSESEQFLATVAFHFGSGDTRTVSDIITPIPCAQQEQITFVAEAKRILSTTMCNLLPLNVKENLTDNLKTVFGAYYRSTDQSRRDGDIRGPGTDDSFGGATEQKNRSDCLSGKCLENILKKLLDVGARLSILVVSQLQNDRQTVQTVLETSPASWCYLHLGSSKSKWACQWIPKPHTTPPECREGSPKRQRIGSTSVQNQRSVSEKHLRLLVVIELGLETAPFDCMNRVGAEDGGRRSST